MTEKNRKKNLLKNPLVMAGGFALLNVLMYLLLRKFWIGGSSFLPMVGKMGKENTLLFSFIVNMGVIGGAFIGALTSGEFKFRLPVVSEIPKAIAGGILIGIGITLAPGTCTTSFVTGIPMLSVSSFLSAAGIFIGGYVMFRMMWRRP
jgi:hypothetical protein